MEKKARSSVMMETLSRIKSFKADGMTEFEVVLFEEKMLLVAPVEEWPLCEAMIAFFSGGFPLRKAQEYVALRKPFFFNDLEKQEWLFDRRVVYSILEAIEVPVPKHVVYNADDPSPPVIEDNEEYLQVGGIRISKPLVEKPVSGEDHNIYLYYPRSQGGGSKRLFRKVRDGRGAPTFHPTPLDLHARCACARLHLRTAASASRWAIVPPPSTRTCTRRGCATATRTSTRSCC
jgi:inositol hexakisphosphate/diphosphoinositol-pentakisphosphate kinase